MTDNDLRSAAIAALFALETLEADVHPDVWHYTSVVEKLKHALGRRESQPEEQLDWADLIAMPEEK